MGSNLEQHQLFAYASLFSACSSGDMIVVTAESELTPDGLSPYYCECPSSPNLTMYKCVILNYRRAARHRHLDNNGRLPTGLLGRVHGWLRGDLQTVQGVAAEGDPGRGQHCARDQVAALVRRRLRLHGLSGGERVVRASALRAHQYGRLPVLHPGLCLDRTARLAARLRDQCRPAAAHEGRQGLSLAMNREARGPLHFTFHLFAF